MKIPTLLVGTAIALLSLIVPQRSALADAAKPLQIVTVGDSTVANYALTNVMRGWGQVLPEYLNSSAKVINLAVGGRSTKTFLETGNWQKALDAHPDFIFIQFGHNDSHAKGQPESTDANGEYMELLRRYVGEARNVNATPILVTPPHRLMFNKESGKLTLELKPYADAMKRVAAETQTPIIDLYTRSGEIFEPLGDNGVEGITASATDRTHFTEKGARILAEFIAQEAAKIDPRLKAALK